MNARYRLVHFVPDPFLGGRVPVAALIESGERVTLRRFSHLPDIGCVGGSRAASVMQMALEDIEADRRFDHLPAGAGPHAVLDSVLEVPADIADPVAWVETHVLKSPDTVRRAHRSPTRLAYGKAFLRTHHVDGYVKPRFRPTHRPEMLFKQAAPLTAVTQYVEGGAQILLLEPLAPTRAEFRQDVSRVCELFGAYGHLLTKSPPQGLKLRLIVYVLAGGDAARRAAGIEKVSDFAEVVDTELPTPAAAFVNEVRSVGETGSLL